MKLFPNLKKPYIIVTPPYTHTSSGVRTLHLLCHALNLIGERAFICLTDRFVTFPPNRQPPTNIAWLTPCLGENTIKFYADKKLEPIVIYPDITRGNPLSADKIVRYLLAPAGLFGGDSIFKESDKIYACTRDIATIHKGKPLILPCSDTNIFYSPKLNLTDMLGPTRSGSCFYSHKYDKIHGNKLLPITEDSKRLEGSLEDIADTLRTSTVCYVYEFSNIIIEAGLCGCPVILIRTPYFDKLLGDDWKWPHVTWHDEPRDLPITWRTEVLSDYHDRQELFLEQLKDFVADTQTM